MQENLSRSSKSITSHRIIEVLVIMIFIFELLLLFRFSFITILFIGSPFFKDPFPVIIIIIDVDFKETILNRNVFYRLGGPDPLDYISMYANPGISHENIPPHWHYIRFLNKYNS